MTVNIPRACSWYIGLTVLILVAFYPDQFKDERVRLLQYSNTALDESVAPIAANGPEELLGNLHPYECTHLHFRMPRS